ncbi:hypothetical protein, partial [Candidatus Cardinium sp. cBcalN1]|uniref:hypothetical protein n=1 Tax=Candidatus Cardinium sp. cBcalN1 TaxID=2699437 RepID=UPI001FB53BFF
GKKLRKSPLTAGKTESTLQHPLQLFFYFSYKGRFLIATILQGAFFFIYIIIYNNQLNISLKLTPLGERKLIFSATIP